MSIHIIADVWTYSKARGTARLVLLALADNADRETRVAWPSVRDLSERTLVSERSVQRALRVLEGLREIELVVAGGPPDRTARYRVLPRGRQPVTTPAESGDTDDEERRHRRLKVVPPVSPEPSVEPSYEPGSARNKKQGRRRNLSRYDEVMR